MRFNYNFKFRLCKKRARESRAEAIAIDADVDELAMSLHSIADGNRRSIDDDLLRNHLADYFSKHDVLCVWTLFELRVKTTK